MVTVAFGFFFDTAYYQGAKGVGDIGHQHQQHPAAGSAQLACEQVGLIVTCADRRQDLIASGWFDNLLAVQHP